MAQAIKSRNGKQLFAQAKFKQAGIGFIQSQKGAVLLTAWRIHIPVPVAQANVALIQSIMLGIEQGGPFDQLEIGVAFAYASLAASGLKVGHRYAYRYTGTAPLTVWAVKVATTATEPQQGE